MVITIALALVSQAQHPPPDGDRWAWRRTAHTISDTLTCEPNGTFSVILRWRLREGVQRAIITRNGTTFPPEDTNKLVSVLSRATDLNFVQLGCLGRRDATVRITYVRAYHGSWQNLARYREDQIGEHGGVPISSDRPISAVGELSWDTQTSTPPCMIASLEGRM